jgi:hypothetical protein
MSHLDLAIGNGFDVYLHGLHRLDIFIYSAIFCNKWLKTMVESSAQSTLL